MVVLVVLVRTWSLPYKLLRWASKLNRRFTAKEAYDVFCETYSKYSVQKALSNLVASDLLMCIKQGVYEVSEKGRDAVRFREGFGVAEG